MNQKKSFAPHVNIKLMEHPEIQENETSELETESVEESLEDLFEDNQVDSEDEF